MTAPAAREPLFPPTPTGSGEGPVITKVCQLAIHMRLRAEGAEDNLCEAALMSDACLKMVESAIRKDIARARTLSVRSQVLFMHPSRYALVGPRGPGVARVSSADRTWMQPPGTYHWLDQILYIVDERGAVRTMMSMTGTQLENVEDFEGVSRPEPFAPILESVREALKRSERSSFPSDSNVRIIRPTTQLTRRMTPHVPRRLTIPGSRMTLFIVSRGDEQHEQICWAIDRIANRHLPAMPACVFIDQAVLPDVDLGMDLVDQSSDHMDPKKRLPTLFEELLGSPVRRFDAPPQIDWDKERHASKLPQSALKWWGQFSSLPSSPDERLFTCVVTQGTARFLLEILEPGGRWRANERHYLSPGQELIFQWVDTRPDGKLVLKQQLRSFGFM